MDRLRSREGSPGRRPVQPGSSPERRLVDLPNRGLTYVRDVAGPPGAPVALLLHGWTGTADLNWSSSFDALSRHFRVIASTNEVTDGAFGVKDPSPWRRAPTTPPRCCASWGSAKRSSSGTRWVARSRS